MAKIKNICITLKVGKKEYTIKNLILDELLEVYANSLIDDYKTMRKLLKECCVKFDNPIQFNEKSKIQDTEFDILIFANGNGTTEISSNKIINKYEFEWNPYRAIDPKTGDPASWYHFMGKKICTLGFGYDFENTGKYNVCAIVDISNYDIYVEETEDIYITRIDIISTDAIFTSSNIEKIKGPIHLCNGIYDFLENETYSRAYAKLTEVGFSDFVDRIQKQIDLQSNYEVNGSVFSIKNLYSSPGLFPSNDIFPSDELIPSDIPFDYIVMKFKVFAEKLVDIEKVEVDTGEYYYQAIPLDKKGSVDFNIRYERG